MRSIIISTLVFFPASFYLHRYLDEWGLDKGRTRTLLVLLLASVIGYAAAFVVDILLG